MSPIYFFLLILLFGFGLVFCTSLEKVQSVSDFKDASSLLAIHSSALEAEQKGISRPIEEASRLISDLEQEIHKCLSREHGLPEGVVATDNRGAQASQYNNADLADVEFERQNNQVQSLIDQVRQLGSNMEGTIKDLNSNGRLVTASIMKSMLHNVRRVENNLERFQARVQTMQSTSRPSSSSGGSQSATMSANINQMLVPIRNRINKLNEDVTQLMNRIRATLTPNSQANPSAASSGSGISSVLRPIAG